MTTKAVRCPTNEQKNGGPMRVVVEILSGLASAVLAATLAIPARYPAAALFWSLAPEANRSHAKAFIVHAYINLIPFALVAYGVARWRRRSFLQSSALASASGPLVMLIAAVVAAWLAPQGPDVVLGSAAQPALAPSIASVPQLRRLLAGERHDRWTA